METVTLKVSGMSCDGCVASVTRVLRAIPGVGEVAVALGSGAAMVTYDPQLTGRAALERAVTVAGYEVGT